MTRARACARAREAGRKFTKFMVLRARMREEARVTYGKRVRSGLGAIASAGLRTGIPQDMPEGAGCRTGFLLPGEARLSVPVQIARMRPPFGVRRESGATVRIDDSAKPFN